MTPAENRVASPMRLAAALPVVALLCVLGGCGNDDADEQPGAIKYRLIEQTERGSSFGSWILQDFLVGPPPHPESLRGEFWLKPVVAGHGVKRTFAITSLHFESNSFLVTGDSGRIEVRDEGVEPLLKVVAPVVINGRHLELRELNWEGLSVDEILSFRHLMIFHQETLNQTGFNRDGFVLRIFAEAEVP